MFEEGKEGQWDRNVEMKDEEVGDTISEKWAGTDCMEPSNALFSEMGHSWRVLGGADETQFPSTTLGMLSELQEDTCEGRGPSPLSL